MSIFDTSKCMKKLRLSFLIILLFAFTLYYYNVKKEIKRKKLKSSSALKHLRAATIASVKNSTLPTYKFKYADFIVHNMTHNLPSRLKDDVFNHFDIDKCLISKILHQTWKKNKVEEIYKNYIMSWLEKNQDWSYSFTTNELNRIFMETKFPEFLEMFDNYKSEIQRADAVRYFLLYEYGGIYADIDFEALKSMNTFLDENIHASDGTGIKHGCIVGQEPFEHAHILYNKKRLICNAIMMSCPKHPFWLIVFQELMLRKNIKTVRATGPKMLSAALNKYEELLKHSNNGVGNYLTLPSVYVPSPYLFYPNFDDANSNHRKNCRNEYRNASINRAIACEKLESTNYQNDPKRRESAVAIHHWAHTWHRPNMDGYGKLYSIDDICNDKAVAWTKANDVDGRVGSRRVNLLKKISRN